MWLSVDSRGTGCNGFGIYGIERPYRLLRKGGRIRDVKSCHLVVVVTMEDLHTKEREPLSLAHWPMCVILMSLGTVPNLIGKLCSSCGCTSRAGAAAVMISRVNIVSVGKAGRDEAWVTSAIDVYTTRLRSILDVQTTFVKDDNALTAAVRKSSGGVLVLDERGKQCTSVEFAERLFTQLDDGGSRLSFFIGGAAGLPDALKQDRSILLSLGPLTFPHQVARLLLVEQIYRATEIRKGSGYHKD